MVSRTGRASPLGVAVYGAGSRPATRGALVFRVGVVVLAAVLLLCLRRWLFRG